MDIDVPGSIYPFLPQEAAAVELGYVIGNQEARLTRRDPSLLTCLRPRISAATAREASKKRYSARFHSLEFASRFLFFFERRFYVDSCDFAASAVYHALHQFA
jgi:hypothetical protein